MAAYRTRSWTWCGLGLLLMAFGCGERREIAQGGPAPPKPVAQGEKAMKREDWVFEPLALSGESDVRVTVSLTSGPAVDFFVMTEAGYNRWKAVVGSRQQAQEDEFETVPMLGMQGLSAAFTSEWTRLSPATYYLVFDNTSYGGTAPPAEGGPAVATVTYSVESRAPGQ